MREWRKKVDNSGGIERCAGLVLRAFYNRWKIIHAAGEPGKEGVHKGKVRVRKAAICPTLRSNEHKKLRGRTTELIRKLRWGHCFLGSVTLNIG